METPNTGLRACHATWARGLEVEWWDWEFDEDKQAYIRHGEVVTPVRLLLLVAEMREEGWQLCRQVV